ncbi:CAP domain-containing protein [[Clostridium] polysaccharolyticum]|uniref:Uncharacterized conserved protein YkwD, contains CAP (CSP/antigen 5/PR1) domain n=1 Tax=[Clostridium] polysaccharolyticum TaxID=29364 RepID=A0A1I0D1D5_9FIRM|nr:CAP domain-containing protein [[Clostridium] polysaccharolyticum]SET25729.1 Uncharacterized conserved protein YkwD, contains CAP (CSP/antigen 5/PR1) domain [[Clostridium] polysaccharolyticum]
MQQFKKTYRALSIIMIMAVFSISWNGKTGESLVQAASSLEKPVLKAASRTSATVQLKYSKVKGAAGYQIYRATKGKGTYKKIKTTKELTYKDMTVSGNTAYSYKVRAYQEKNRKNIYSSFSSAVTVNRNLSKVTGLLASSSANGIRLKWNAVTNGTCYRIYRSNSKSGSYQYIASTAKTSFTSQNLAEGKTYFYKVRAYTESSQVKYYGSSSNAAEAKYGTTQSNGSYQQQVIDLVNKERRAAGLSTVTTTSKLESAAYKRAEEIVEVFDHTRPDGTSFYSVLGEYQILYTACGENIAWGQRTPAEVMEGWMNSPGHRQNILSSKYGKVGIGYYTVNNRAYWVQIFTN